MDLERPLASQINDKTELLGLHDGRNTLIRADEFSKYTMSESLDAALASRKISSYSIKTRLFDAMNRVSGRPQMPAPGEVPMLIFAASPSWAQSTAYTLGQFIFNGAYVFQCLKAGTSSGSGTGPAWNSAVNVQGGIVDGTAIWQCIGPRVPVVLADGLTLAVDQRVYSGGSVYRVTGAGTTASGGFGTATAVYEGPQTLPAVTLAGSAFGGSSKRVAWNDTTASVLGGTRVQESTNAWCLIVSKDGTGSAYSTASGGGGSVYTITDAPILDYALTGAGTIAMFVDGVLVAQVVTTTGGQYVHMDFTGLPQPRKERTFRALTSATARYVGWYATAADLFQSYSPATPLRGVLIGDSFTDGALSVPMAMLYSHRLGMRLGIEDFRVAGHGSTGVLRSAGAAVSYTDRFTQDVISQAPDLVIIQNSGNDNAGIAGTGGGSTFTQQQLVDAEIALVNRVRNELPNAALVVINQWTNRGPLSGAALAADTAVRAALTAAGAVQVLWDDFTTDGGFVGSATSTGNSLYHTGSDGIHPSPLGHDMRARRLESRFRAAYSEL